ncbi:MAG: helix-turn-helix domain-containing protein [Microlunatus sp.]
MDPVHVERPSTPGLQSVVQRFWYLRAPSPQRFERIVPIPSVHLIVNLADAPYRVLARGRELVGDTFLRSFLAGVQMEYLLNENPPLIHHVGAALHPWALRAFDIDPDQAARRVQDAASLFPGIDTFSSPLDSAAPDSAIDALETFLAKRIRHGWQADPRVVVAVNSMLADPGRPIRELAIESGLTPKGFSAAFQRHCGITPKRFAEICRHQVFLAELPTEGELPRWSDLIGSDRYYDQPHFISEFRRFTGITPTAYLQHRRRFGHGNPSFLPMDDELLAQALGG